MRFGIIETDIWFDPRYNIAPGQELPVVVAEDSRVLKLMRWGLVPGWAKDVSIGYKMINARAETISEKPSFKKPFREERCLIPADGFYEWKKMPNSRAKTPYRVCLKSEEPFAFAGLWDSWVSSEGKELQTYTIITTEPNDLVRPIHNRMPVILLPENEDKWLDTGLKDTSSLATMLKPYPSELMETYEISSLVNSPKNDIPECWQRVGK